MPAVGRTARALGYAGLLPPLATTAAIALARASGDVGYGELLAPVLGLAIVYPLAILSFLGGVWWGFAMRREHAQGRLAALAVAPSLVAVALVAAIGTTTAFDWGLVAIGSAVLLTLPVDHHLVLAGDAPAGWMRLRVPLSVGLGGLTILSGALVGGPGSSF